MKLETYRLTLTHRMIDDNGDETMIDEPITTQVVVPASEYLVYPRALVVNEMLHTLMNYMLREVTKKEEKR